MASAELFSFGVGQDQKDSTQQIAQAGQGGLGLPDRDYYLLRTPVSRKFANNTSPTSTKMFSARRRHAGKSRQRSPEP